MKILLVEADFVREVGDRQSFFTKPSAPTLGVNYLGSLLRNQGHEVIVLDSLYEYLRTGFVNQVDVVEGTKDILEKERNIECVGISITSPTRNYALNIAKEVKTFNSRIKVIAGGPHITILRKMFLEKFSQFFDFLVIGEGDRTLPELMNALEGKMSIEEVAGIIYLDSRGKIKKTPPRAILSEKELDDINIVPFTDYPQYQEILPNGVVPAITLVTTRGCPYHCTFCYSPHLWKKYRTQSSKRVLAEIEYIIEKYKVRNIRFQDDTFTFNKNRCLKIFEGIKAKGWNIDLYMHTRFDCVDEDIIKDYAEAGGRDIYFGLESGSQKLRIAMDKNHGITNEKILEICGIVKDYSLNLGLWLIFGYPEETEEDIKVTYELVRDIDPAEVTCNPVHVHPYTRLFTQCEKEGIYTIKDWLSNEQDFFLYYPNGQSVVAYNNCVHFRKVFNKKKVKPELNIDDVETTVKEFAQYAK